MLQAAAPTHAEMRTTRRHPFRRRRNDLDCFADVITIALLAVNEQHLLTGQRPLDEGRLAVDVSDTLPIMAQGIDVGTKGLGGQLLAAAGHGLVLSD